MQYIYVLVIAFVAAIGFGIGRIITKVLEEVIFERLHKSEKYAVICKKTSNVKPEKKHRPYKNTVIGFHMDEAQ